ncbi:Hypothetical predicted protein [Xyrichtys novacula]|uniref:Uncharacterized protein n=1 Tax=Xyrichtys novacula TaxID=13765 RepID=A0AAV1GIN5_XYRNO|nr:Hypothetical predicted protein [Xyrichtys novacula]
MQSKKAKSKPGLDARLQKSKEEKERERQMEEEVGIRRGHKVDDGVAEVREEESKDEKDESWRVVCDSPTSAGEQRKDEQSSTPWKQYTGPVEPQQMQTLIKP